LVSLGITRLGCIAAIVAALGLAIAAPPAAAALQTLSIGQFNQPIYLTAPPNDPTRLFVVERAGRIQVISSGVRKQFLDISSTVDSSPDTERGLLSMAFAPDYATSGLFYVFDVEAGTEHVKIEEFHRSAANPDAADPASRRVVVDEPHHNTFHNGGQLQFGPDGHLYATIGDDELRCNAPDLTKPYGKLLRIDPQTGWQVWSSGLRNPWRFSFDRSTGDLVIADVGEATSEEINFVPASSTTGQGLDFGWPAHEGLVAGPGGCTLSPTAPTDPVLAYGHGGGACAITGGYVVRADDLPSLAGRYIYGDYCTGAIRSAVLKLPSASDDRSENVTLANLDSFGEDSCGHVYAMATGNPSSVYRLSESAAPPACPAVAPSPQPEPGLPPPTPAPPTLFAQFRSQQRVLRTRVLTVGAGCDQPCAVELSAVITGTGRTHRPRATGRSAAGGAAAIVKHQLRLTVRGTARIRNALRSGKRVVAVVTVAATNTAGVAATPKTVRIAISG
jgi:hypothetical protein